jgi:hypothetical protein
LIAWVDGEHNPYKSGGGLMTGKFQAFYEPVHNELVGLELGSEDDLDVLFKQTYGADKRLLAGSL